MVIKQIGRSYLKELVKLDVLAFKPLNKRLGRHTAKDARDYLVSSFKKGKMYGYFIDDKLVGCIGLTIQKKFKCGEVGPVLVNPKFQGSGIGTELMKFIESKARKLRLKTMRLSVRSKNDRAISFYKKCGFKIHAYLMRKKF